MNNFFTNYPDTDFHELNLDWLLTEWTKYREQFDGLLTRMDTIEAAFKDLKDFVNDYFDNLDVREEIFEKLDAMMEDGQLQVLLQRVIDNPSVMHLVPVFSISKYRGYYDRNNEADYPAFMQTACCDGANMFLFYMNPVNQGNVIIEKRSLSTKEVLASGQIAGGYHANGSDYYDGSIYLATIQNGILEIDPESLTVTSRHSFDILFRSVSIDNDGTVYAESGMDLYTLDLTNDTYHKETSLYFDNQDIQSGIVRDGWLYEAGINPSCMYKINAKNGMVSKIYPIDRYVDQYPVGEVESIANNRTTGDFYVISTAYEGFYNYRQCQVFGCNLSTNSAERRFYSGGSYLGGGAIYVDQSYTGGLPDGSETKPFASLSAALLAYKSPYRKTVSAFQIILNSDCKDEPLYIRSNHALHINGNNHVIPAIYVRDGSLSVSNLIIKNDIMVNDTAFQRPVYAIYERINFDNVTFEKPTGIFNNPDYAAVFNSCVGSCYNATLWPNANINNYRSNIIFNQGIKSNVYYTNDNQPNMSVAQASLSSLTPAQVNNIGNCDLILLRVVKSSMQTLCQFPVDDSHTAQCFLRIGNYLECYTILCTKVDDGVFRFSTQDSRRMDPSTGEWTTTDDPVLAGVYFFSMS